MKINVVMLVIFHVWLLFVSCGIWNARAGKEDSWHYGHCIGTEDIRFLHTGFQETGKDLRVNYFQILNNCSFPSVKNAETEKIDYSRAYVRYSVDPLALQKTNVHLHKENIGKIARVRFEKKIVYVLDMDEVERYLPWVMFVEDEESSISSSFTVGLAGGLLSFVSIMIFLATFLRREEIVEHEKLE